MGFIEDIQNLGIAPDIIAKICQSYGGQRVYIATENGRQIEKKHIAIITAFKTGETYQNIARRFGISERWAREIIAEQLFLFKKNID